MDIPIVFEDESLVVIDKPAGLTVNKAETTAGQETVQEWAERQFSIFNLQFSSDNQEFADRAGIVHRLDKETSGLLVIAKMPEAFAALKGQFQSREVKKTYVALVHGRVEPTEGIVDAPIERSPFNRTHFGVFPGGRAAVTAYKVTKVYQRSGEEYSLLELAPQTGRTHQIRVHMKYLGHPLVSDPLYDGRKQLREDRKFCPRLFLHAAALKINHPETGEEMSFQSSLPADLEKALGYLQEAK